MDAQYLIDTLLAQDSLRCKFMDYGVTASLSNMEGEVCITVEGPKGQYVLEWLEDCTVIAPNEVVCSSVKIARREDLYEAAEKALSEALSTKPFDNSMIGVPYGAVAGPFPSR